MKNDELLHKWVNGSLNAEELEAFKQRPEYESLEKLNKSTEHLSVPSFDEEGMLATILAQAKTTIAPKALGKRRVLSSWMKYAAAAAVLLLGILFFWPQNTTVKYEAGRAEQKTGRLPNGSTFTLNAGSSLAYNPESWDVERNVDLEGEAFFEVEKGRPFKVHTLNGMVEVLGTKFNVWSRHQRLEVQCQSGKVAVSTSEKGEQNILIQNEAISITSGQASEKWTMATNTNVSWVEGITKFKKVPLFEVLEELERQFDIHIDAQQVNVNEIISCNFDHNNLDLALKTSLSSLAIRYEVDGQRVALVPAK